MANISPTLIGLVGRQRAGKDSVAHVLTAEYDFTQLAFADALREAALGIDPLVGFTVEDLWPLRLSSAVRVFGWEGAKVRYPEVRRILQRTGTEAIRTLDPEFWLRQLESRLLATDAPVVVSDVRFENEAALIRHYGGTLILVDRPDAIRPLSAHASENVDGIEVEAEIINDGSLEDLAQSVRALMHA